MTRAALLASALLVAALSACSEDTCDERSCADGCCGADGLCRTSRPTSCGLQGAPCVDCTAQLLACVEGACETYDAGCLPNGTACLGLANCCSGICSKGRCSDTECKTNGATCASTSECCSDLCDNGVCIAPRQIGEPCSFTAPCQSHLVCDQGVCAPPCIGPNMSCEANDTCCGSGPCPTAIGVCPSTCREIGEQCGVGDCCVGLQCVNGFCST